MYFCMIWVRLVKEFALSTMDYISLKSLTTLIPMPRFEFSPGFIIHMLSGFCEKYSRKLLNAGSFIPSLTKNVRGSVMKGASPIYS